MVVGFYFFGATIDNCFRCSVGGHWFYHDLDHFPHKYSDWSLGFRIVREEGESICRDWRSTRDIVYSLRRS